MRKLTFVAVLVTAAFILAATAQAFRYPYGFRTGFIHTCTSNAPYGACVCVLNYIEAHISYRRLYRQYFTYLNGGPEPAIFYRAAYYCVG